MGPIIYYRLMPTNLAALFRLSVPSVQMKPFVTTLASFSFALPKRVVLFNSLNIPLNHFSVYSPDTELATGIVLSYIHIELVGPHEFGFDVLIFVIHFFPRFLFRFVLCFCLRL